MYNLVMIIIINNYGLKPRVNYWMVNCAWYEYIYKNNCVIFNVTFIIIVIIVITNNSSNNCHNYDEQPAPLKNDARALNLK